jgi:hypothetical protein
VVSSLDEFTHSHHLQHLRQLVVFVLKTEGHQPQADLF